MRANYLSKDEELEKELRSIDLNVKDSDSSPLYQKIKSEGDKIVAINGRKKFDPKVQLVNPDDFFPQAKPPGKRGPKYKFSVEQIAEALTNSKGSKSRAARILNTTLITLDKYIKKNKRLQEILNERREALLDMSEEVLTKRLAGGDIVVAQFILRTIGRDRGYGEIVVHEDKGPPKFRYTYVPPLDENQEISGKPEENSKDNEQAGKTKEN